MRRALQLVFVAVFPLTPLRADAQLNVGAQPKKSSAPTTVIPAARVWWEQDNVRYSALPNQTHCQATVPESLLVVSPSAGDRFWVHPVGQRCVSSTPYIVFSDGRRTREFTPQEIAVMGGGLYPDQLPSYMRAYPMRMFVATAQGLDSLNLVETSSGGFWLRPATPVLDSIRAVAIARATAEARQHKADSIETAHRIAEARRQEQLHAQAERDQAATRERTLRATLREDGASEQQVRMALAGRISLGLTRRAVLQIWGIPARQTVADGIEVWVYADGRAARFYSGRLTAYTQ